MIPRDEETRMKPPIYHRMFGYNLALLPNPQLAVLENGVSAKDPVFSKLPISK